MSEFLAWRWYWLQKYLDSLTIRDLTAWWLPELDSHYTIMGEPIPHANYTITRFPIESDVVRKPD